MSKRKGSLARVVTVFLALIVALALSGMGYGLWSDFLFISGTVETGIIDTELDWIGSECKPPTTGTGIGGYAAEMTLYVNVTKAKRDVDSVVVHYYCSFNIDNNTGSGTLPVKIDGYKIYESYEGVEAEVTGVVLGEQIDPGETYYGSGMHIYLTDDTYLEENLYFTVDIYVVQWDQYVGP